MLCPGEVDNRADPFSDELAAKAHTYSGPKIRLSTKFTTYVKPAPEYKTSFDQVIYGFAVRMLKYLERLHRKTRAHRKIRVHRKPRAHKKTS
jgi:hypothetical protein